MAKKEERVEVAVREADSQQVRIKIIGDTDLVLNKMGDYTKRMLILKQKGIKPSKTDACNPWEDIVTSVHWFDSLGDVSPKEYSEEMLQRLVKENKPCLSAFGVKQQLCKAVTRYGIDKYKTKFSAALNIVTEKRDLIPVEFGSYELVEDLIPTNTASRVPVLAEFNTFHDWSAEIDLDLMGSMFSIDDVMQIFYLCGKGIGVGSAVSSGYGRFHVEGVS